MKTVLAYLLILAACGEPISTKTYSAQDVLDSDESLLCEAASPGEFTCATEFDASGRQRYWCPASTLAAVQACVNGCGGGSGKWEWFPSWPSGVNCYTR